MMYGLIPQDQPQSFDNILQGIKAQMEELKSANRYAESTKSLTYLPIIHDRQKKRMSARSEWFLAHSIILFCFVLTFIYNLFSSFRSKRRKP